MELDEQLVDEGERFRTPQQVREEAPFHRRPEREVVVDVELERDEVILDGVLSEPLEDVFVIASADVDGGLVDVDRSGPNRWRMSFIKRRAGREMEESVRRCAIVNHFCMGGDTKMRRRAYCFCNLCGSTGVGSLMVKVAGLRSCHSGAAAPRGEVSTMSKALEADAKRARNLRATPKHSLCGRSKHASTDLMLSI